MTDPIQPLVTPAEYLLSNGTRVLSSVPVNYYTDNEILKIEIAGGIAAVAVLVLTYIAYQYVTIRYAKWAHQKEMEERLEAGEPVPQDVEVIAVSPINRKLIFLVGGLVILAGIVMVIMPS